MGERQRMKICVSVDKENWQSAASKLKKERSSLVDWLILNYLDGDNRRLEMGAV